MPSCAATAVTRREGAHGGDLARCCMLGRGDAGQNADTMNIAVAVGFLRSPWSSRLWLRLGYRSPVPVSAPPLRAGPSSREVGALHQI